MIGRNQILKMKLRKKILLVALACFLLSFSIAQQMQNESTEGGYRAFFWGSEQGLDQTRIFCLLKDVNGFLWIGTQNLLSRFDGFRFKNYYHHSNESGAT